MSKFTIEYNGTISQIELRCVFYKEKKIGYMYLYVNNKNEGMYLFYKLKNVFKKRCIEICDIPRKLSDKYKNCGIGSKALRMLDEIAIRLKVTNIFGGISRHDDDHIDRLTHFYTKNGYEILLDKNNMPCGINKIVRL